MWDIDFIKLLGLNFGSNWILLNKNQSLAFRTGGSEMKKRFEKQILRLFIKKIISKSKCLIAQKTYFWSGETHFTMLLFKEAPKNIIFPREFNCFSMKFFYCFSEFYKNQWGKKVLKIKISLVYVLCAEFLKNTSRRKERKLLEKLVNLNHYRFLLL